ncbi:succinylglutamate desuccinylase/aspartoacylase family protein [bacterium]|nr:succinylglutamate desuccinylase/aspartoacylase family protein [bacterium]
MKTISENINRTRFKNSFSKILTGSVVASRRLPVMEASSGLPGPVVWLTACSHGDEVGGIVVIQEIFKLLRRLPLFCGKLKAFPIMNPIGFENVSRSIPFSKEDLNRSFPGSSGGSLAERIAHVVFTGIMQSDTSLVLDLHNDWKRSIPYTLLDPHPGESHESAFSQVEEISRWVGFPVISEQMDSSADYSFKKTLSYSLLSRDIPALTLELGESYVVNERNVVYGVNAIWQVLHRLGMVDEHSDQVSYPLPKIAQNNVLKYSDLPYASTSGIFRFLIKPGDRVRANQPVGKIYDAFGRSIETVRATADGIVLGHTDYSVTFPGKPLVAFGLK